jgi:hypothetical protein
MSHEERWLVLLGWEDQYLISSHGRVMRRGSQRILRPMRTRVGYLRVRLSHGSRRRVASIHRLMLESFTGPHPHLQVNHIDGVKTNNHLDNIEWSTQAENMAHAARMGLMPRGDRSGARLHPEKWTRGDDHWTRRYPERVPRGDQSSSRRRPERLARGEASGLAKLTTVDVLKIRKLAAVGVFQKDIAPHFGISKENVSSIVTRRTWKHLPVEE